jgi:hypothetical protein
MTASFGNWSDVLLRQLSLTSLAAIGTSVVVTFLQFYPLVVRKIPNRSSCFACSVSRVLNVNLFWMILLMLKRSFQNRFSILLVVCPLFRLMCACVLCFNLFRSFWMIFSESALRLSDFLSIFLSVSSVFFMSRFRIRLAMLSVPFSDPLSVFGLPSSDLFLDASATEIHVPIGQVLCVVKLSDWLRNPTFSTGFGGNNVRFV